MARALNNQAQALDILGSLNFRAQHAGECATATLENLKLFITDTTIPVHARTYAIRWVVDGINGPWDFVKGLWGDGGWQYSELVYSLMSRSR